MYWSGDFLHFRLYELQAMSSIVAILDESTAKRLDNIYSYHKLTLKENDNQPLMLHISETKDFRRFFHRERILQPEFIFSDDEEIF